MIYYLLLMHWLADFPFQIPWMAQNKSHNQLALLAHVITYGTVLATGMYFIMPDVVPVSTFIMFIAFNVVCHYVTDTVTSKITKFFWEKKQMYLFFTTIGLDQLIHACTLIFSCRMFLEKVVGKEWLLG